MKKFENKNTLIVSYIEAMRVLASSEMFGYYRYTRENQEEGQTLQKFYEYQEKYRKYSIKLEKIIKKMLKSIPKKQYPYEYWALDNTQAGWYQAYADILQKLRGEK